MDDLPASARHQHATDPEALRRWGFTHTASSIPTDSDRNFICHIALGLGETGVLSVQALRRYGSLEIRGMRQDIKYLCDDDARPEIWSRRTDKFAQAAVVTGKVLGSFSSSGL